MRRQVSGHKRTCHEHRRVGATTSRGRAAEENANSFNYGRLPRYLAAGAHERIEGKCRSLPRFISDVHPATSEEHGLADASWGPALQHARLSPWATAA